MGEEDAENFEEKIRKLVMSSLAGKDIEFATQLAEESINQAKVELEQAKETIDSAFSI
jgi:RNase H-fold protein (predicted Holliday junction resolvase)